MLRLGLGVLAVVALEVLKKPLPDWRMEFPESGPAADAPAQSVERFLCLNLAEFARYLDRLVDYGLHGIRDNPQESSDSTRREPTSDDVVHLRLQLRNLVGKFSSLQKWAQISGFAAGKQAAGHINLDAVASEICRRNALEWTGVEAKTPTPHTVREMGAEGPSSRDPLAIKRDWFQTLLSLTSRASDAVARRGPSVSTPAQMDLLKIADSALKLKRAVLVEWANVVGAILSIGDRQTQRAIDLMFNCLMQHQRARKKKDWKAVDLETLKWLVERMKSARTGDYFAYRQVNGFTESSKGGRWSPLFFGPTHKEMIQCLLSDLTCRGCGKFHLQDTTPVFVPETEMEMFPPVKCPHCGMENCAGQRSHRLAACRGLGKSTEGRHSLAYRIGLYISRDYIPEVMLLAWTKEEAKKRKRLLQDIMRRAAHRLIFPEAVPEQKQPAEAMTVQGIDRAIAQCYGILSVPPGAHVDIAQADDVVNADNTFRTPAMMPVINDKMDNVIAYSDKPWTVIDWLTTVWRIGDADDKLEQWAVSQPDKWNNLVIAAGGPEPVHDESGKVVRKPWWSPWKERWAEDDLQRLYERDPFAYQRAMMMVRVSDADVVFRGFRFYVKTTDPLFEACPKEFLANVPVVDEAETASWPGVLGVDLAYTLEQDANSRSSRTCSTLVRVHPWTKDKCVICSSGSYIPPSEQFNYIETEGIRHRKPDIEIESDKGVKELIDRLAEKGFDVDLYNPAKYGDKRMRKVPLAMDVSAGRIVFPGKLKQVESGIGWTVVASPDISGKHSLMDDLLLYPSKVGDFLDSMEIACRIAEERYGGLPIEPPAGPRGEPSEFKKWRDSVYETPKKPDGVLAEVDEFVGDIGRDLEAAGIIGEYLGESD